VVADRLAAHPSREPIVEKAFIHAFTNASTSRGNCSCSNASPPASPNPSNCSPPGCGWPATRGLIDPGGEEVAVRRAAFADELRTLVRRLHRSRALALRDLEQP